MLDLEWTIYERDSFHRFWQIVFLHFKGLCTLGNNFTYSLDCALDDELVLKMLKKNCDDKQTCKMNVELATVLSDPCPGEYKYLDIEFSCERYSRFLFFFLLVNPFVAEYILMLCGC